MLPKIASQFFEYLLLGPERMMGPDIVGDCSCYGFIATLAQLTRGPEVVKCRNPYRCNRPPSFASRLFMR